MSSVFFLKPQLETLHDMARKRSRSRRKNSKKRRSPDVYGSALRALVRKSISPFRPKPIYVREGYEDRPWMLTPNTSQDRDALAARERLHRQGFEDGVDYYINFFKFERRRNGYLHERWGNVPESTEIYKEVYVFKNPNPDEHSGKIFKVDRENYKGLQLKETRANEKMRSIQVI